MARWSRRRTAAVAVCALALLAASACSSGSPAKPSTPTTKATTAGPTALTFGVYGTPGVINAYRQAAAAYNAKAKDARVTIRPFASQASALTAAESATPPDVFLADASQLSDLIDSKAIDHVDDLLADRGVNFGDGFERAALEVFSAHAELQCMPVDFSPMVLYYNTDLLDPQEVDVRSPHDPAKAFRMDELAQAATLATGPGHRGIAVEPGLDQLAPFVWSAGGTLVDDVEKPTALTLASSADQKGISQLLEIVRNPQVTYNQRQLQRRSVLTRFETGQLGMMLGYRDLVPRLRARPELHFDVMPLPRVDQAASVGRATGACISANSKHSGAAADFLASLVSDESMSALAESGSTIPPNLDVLNDDAFLQPGQQPEHASAYLDSMRGTQLMPNVSTWPRVVAATRTAISALWYDVNIDPLETRLTTIDDLAKPILSPPTPSGTPTGSPSGSASPSTGN